MKQTVIAIVALVIIIAGGWYVYNSSAKNDTADQNATSTPGTMMPLSMDGTFKVDSNLSTIKWEGRKILLKDYTDNGSIRFKSGSVVVADGKLSGGDVVVDMTSLKSEHTANTKFGLDALDKHLKSDDFFGIETYPTSSLKIVSVKSTGDMTYDVSADMTIKGKTTKISFPATAYMDGEKLVVEAKLSVDRTVYDIKYGSGKFFEDLGDNVIDDMFGLEVKLVATK